jgi:hypothetical protein
MDREMASKNLVQAERMVALGLRHIAGQELRLKGCDGDDLSRARALLETFKQAQVLHEAHRDRLRRELGLL